MKYRYLVLTILYLLLAFLIDVYLKIPSTAFGTIWVYIFPLLISTLFALATLAYIRFAAGFGSKGQEIFTILLCALILMYPILFARVFPQAVADLVSNLFRRFALYQAILYPQKYAFITISSEIALINAIWNLLSKRQLISTREPSSSPLN